MGAITYDIEIPSSISAAKIFKAVVLDTDTLIPKIMPQAIKNVEILEGDGGVGTIKIIHFGEASQYKSAKHRLDAIDKENLTHTYSITEGVGIVALAILEASSTALMLLTWKTRPTATAYLRLMITYHIKIFPTEDG